MNPTKRNRSVNWDEEEKQLLRSILKDYAQIIEDKSLTTNTSKNKTKAWEEVHKKFNELNCRQRGLGQLKIQWKGMKVNARKTYSTLRQETAKTGGGARPATHKMDRPGPDSASKSSEDYVSAIISHSKNLKEEEHRRRMEMAEEEHRRRMEMAEEEHKINMTIKEEKLKCAILEREILELRKAREVNSVNLVEIN